MEKCLFFVETHTKAASIVYSVEICPISIEKCAALVHKEKFDCLCKEGCSNYNRKWSCPPLSPAFEDVSNNYKYLYVFYLRISLDQLDYIKNDYLKIKAANSILKSRADGFLRYMISKSKNSKYISTGSCRLCKPCKLQKGLPCAHPNIMTYSFEALGVNVEALVNLCFQSPLQWYARGNLPMYTSVVCGLLTNEKLSLETLQEELLNNQK